jgi:hypothetical protein
MGRALRGNHPDEESIEQILEEFEKVCAESLRRKGAPGAKRELHVQAAVVALSDIWLECTGSPVPVSLDTEIGTSGLQEFTYPGPRFCQLVLQSIDPDLSVSQIETAIRNTLGKRRVRKLTKN